MLAFIAAILFAIAFLINPAGIAAGSVFSSFSLMLAGLALLAFHLTGNGPAMPSYKRSRR